MPSSGIAESYGSFILCFLRNLNNVLHSGSIKLHFHQQCKSVPFSPHPLQHLLFVVLKKLFIYLALAVLSLHCCLGFSLVVASGYYSLVAVHRLLIVVASLCCGAWALGHLGFSSCNIQAQSWGLRA